MRTLSAPLLILAVLGCLLVPSTGAAEEAEQPIEVLRRHVSAGIAVLQDERYGEASEAQREQLCAIAREMFDIYAFSRLVLAGHWRDFSDAERGEFVEVFGEFLCRYYLSRLQRRYNSEQVSFSRQSFSSEHRASVEASVVWQDIEVPVEVRMVRREGRWRAYDLVVAGISAVMLYRAQFETMLLKNAPGDLIAELRRRIETQG